MRALKTHHKKGQSASRFLAEAGIIAVIAIVVALLLKTFLFQAFWIPSRSMVPTLNVNDRVLVNKQYGLTGGISRGDIMVFDAPSDVRNTEVKVLVKRVIGLPGDTVEGRDGKVFINGEPLREPYLSSGVRTEAFKPEKVSNNSYFMMGDNRSESFDSRRFGEIAKSAMIGEAFLRFWPASEIAWI